MSHRDHFEPEDLSMLAAALKRYCDLNVIIPHTLEWDLLAQRAFILFQTGIRSVDALAHRLGDNQAGADVPAE